MKTGTMILVGIVLATIAYQVIERISTETLNVVLGVACGIGASIPVTAGLLLALLRQRARAEMYEMPEPEPMPARVQPQPQHIAAPQMPQPQIIVLSPQGQFPQNAQMPAQWMNAMNAVNPYMHEQPNAVDAREWRIIGEE